MAADYYVVNLVNDFELLVNMGEDSGVQVGFVLDVLDPATRDVVDPKTGESLGSIDRAKARVSVLIVGENMSLCKVMNRTPGGSLSAISTVLSGTTSPLIASMSPKWPEGVDIGDPIRNTGRRLAPKGSKSAP